MRLGLFGGTFDPPHYGHLALAESAHRQLNLDKVLWVLAADPPHKQGRAISAVEDRLAMVLAAIAPYPAYELSRVDLDRPGPHYSVDMTALLARQFPQAELIFLMGGDSLRDLPTWHRPLDLLKHCSLGVLRRPDDAVDAALLGELEQTLPGLTARVSFINTPPVAIASHEIRQRIGNGDEFAGWMPEAVERIIRDRHLYRED